MEVEHEEAPLVARASWKGRAMGAVILVLAVAWPIYLYREIGPDVPLAPFVVTLGAWGLFGLALGLRAWTYRVVATNEGLAIHRWWLPPTRIAWRQIEEVSWTERVRSVFMPGLVLRLRDGRRVRIGRHMQGSSALADRIREAHAR